MPLAIRIATPPEEINIGFVITYGHDVLGLNLSHLVEYYDYPDGNSDVVYLIVDGEKALDNTTAVVFYKEDFDLYWKFETEASTTEFRPIVRV